MKTKATKANEAEEINERNNSNAMYTILSITTGKRQTSWVFYKLGLGLKLKACGSRVQSSYHSDTLPSALSNYSKYFVSGCSSATCK